MGSDLQFFGGAQTAAAGLRVTALSTILSSALLSISRFGGALKSAELCEFLRLLHGEPA